MRIGNMACPWAGKGRSRAAETPVAKLCKTKACNGLGRRKKGFIKACAGGVPARFLLVHLMKLVEKRLIAGAIVGPACC